MTDVPRATEEPPDPPSRADDLPGSLHARLLERRVVVVAGPLDDELANRAAAEPHTRFRLCEPDVSLAGSPSRLEAWVEHHRRRVARFCELLAGATGRRLAEVAADLSSGRHLDADQALDYGLIDEIWTQGAEIRRLPGPGTQPGLWAAAIGRHPARSPPGAGSP